MNKKDLFIEVKRILKCFLLFEGIISTFVPN